MTKKGTCGWDPSLSYMHVALLCIAVSINAKVIQHSTWYSVVL